MRSRAINAHIAAILACNPCSLASDGAIFLWSSNHMQISVVGWGSLIWCPGCLRIKSRWHSDGPALPIEFARISRDKRLTLVIQSGSPEQRTYWALSEFGDLKVARENLQAREGTSSKHIHSLTADGQ